MIYIGKKIRQKTCPFLNFMIIMTSTIMLASCSGGRESTPITKKTETIPTNVEIQFNIDKVVSNTPYTPLNLGHGYIANQSEIFSIEGTSKEIFLGVLVKYPALIIKRFNEIYIGATIEYDENNPNSLKQLNDLKNEPIIDEIFNRPYVGKDVSLEF